MDLDGPWSLKRSSHVGNPQGGLWPEAAPAPAAEEGDAVAAGGQQDVPLLLPRLQQLLLAKLGDSVEVLVAPGRGAQAAGGAMPWGPLRAPPAPGPGAPLWVLVHNSRVYHAVRLVLRAVLKPGPGPGAAGAGGATAGPAAAAGDSSAMTGHMP